nr:MAG TPA: hypothetical protein [Caudoviricetes sp.]
MTFCLNFPVCEISRASRPHFSGSANCTKLCPLFCADFFKKVLDFLP